MATKYTLTVYGTSRGYARRIVATRTKAQAAKALEMSARAFRDYASETFNAKEIATAKAKPYTVFTSDQTGGTYTEEAARG